MRRTIVTLLSVALVALAGCQSKPATETAQKSAAAPAQPGVGGDPHAGMKAQEIPAGVGKKGTITQTMNAAGYTYVEAADDKGQKTWLALPEMKVAVGDKIEYPDTPPLVNFTSKTLNKTFEAIHFIPGIRIDK